MSEGKVRSSKPFVLFDCQFGFPEWINLSSVHLSGEIKEAVYSKFPTRATRVGAVTRRIKFPKPISSAEVVEHLEEIGYRPAHVVEMLFVVECTRIELGGADREIVALDTTWTNEDGAVKCPVLLGDMMLAYDFDHVWPAGVQFIVVRKKGGSW